MAGIASIRYRNEQSLNLLSDRELQIMLMVTHGIPVGEIAKQLNLSTKTINSYRYRMFSKLKVRSDVELTHKWIDSNREFLL
ncbi:MAG: LuxR C-terminal-related transcriptional regulator [Candidatus Arsenophonus phytopathogenicus]